MAPIWYWVSPIWSDLLQFGQIWSDLVIRVTALTVHANWIWIWMVIDNSNRLLISRQWRARALRVPVFTALAHQHIFTEY